MHVLLSSLTNWLLSSIWRHWLFEISSMWDLLLSATTPMRISCRWLLMLFGKIMILDPIVIGHFFFRFLSLLLNFTHHFGSLFFDLIPILSIVFTASHHNRRTSSSEKFVLVAIILPLESISIVIWVASRGDVSSLMLTMLIYRRSTLIRWSVRRYSGRAVAGIIGWKCLSVRVLILLNGIVLKFSIVLSRTKVLSVATRSRCWWWSHPVLNLFIWILLPSAITSLPLSVLLRILGSIFNLITDCPFNISRRWGKDLNFRNIWTLWYIYWLRSHLSDLDWFLLSLVSELIIQVILLCLNINCVFLLIKSGLLSISCDKPSFFWLDIFKVRRKSLCLMRLELSLLVLISVQSASWGNSLIRGLSSSHFRLEYRVRLWSSDCHNLILCSLRLFICILFLLQRRLMMNFLWT